MMWNLGKRVSAGLLVAVMAAGCGVQLEGEEGELTFHYLDTQFQSGSSGALAQGARIDVELRQPGGDSALRVKDAFSEDGEVISVIDVETMRFTLEALSVGTARIGAEAYGPDEEVIADFVEIDVAEIAKITFGNRCSDDIFVTDSRAQFIYRMYDADERRLSGFGAYPVSVEPSEGGTINAGSRLRQTVEVHTGSVPGTYQIVAEVGESSYEFELVEPSEIVYVDIDEDADDTSHSVNEGQELAVAIFTMETGNGVVCGPATAAVDLSVADSNVCSASYRYLGDLHFIFVEGLQTGSCDVTMEVPGTEIERNFQVDVN